MTVLKLMVNLDRIDFLDDVDSAFSIFSPAVLHRAVVGVKAARFTSQG